MSSSVTLVRRSVITNISDRENLEDQVNQLRETIDRLRQIISAKNDEIDKLNRRFEARSHARDGRDVLERQSKEILIDRIFALSQSNKELLENNNQMGYLIARYASVVQRFTEERNQLIVTIRNLQHEVRAIHF